MAVYVHGHLISCMAETVLHLLGVDAGGHELGGVRVPESVQVGFVREPGSQVNGGCTLST